MRHLLAKQNSFPPFLIVASSCGVTMKLVVLFNAKIEINVSILVFKNHEATMIKAP